MQYNLAIIKLKWVVTGFLEPVTFTIILTQYTLIEQSRFTDSILIKKL